MLELRPTCEHCNKPLPPDSTEARICSFECTFCASCAELILSNTCPNCGGGFTPRPIRPAIHWKGNNYLGAHPASSRVVHKPVNLDEHADLIEAQGGIPPEER